MISLLYIVKLRTHNKICVCSSNTLSREDQARTEGKLSSHVYISLPRGSRRNLSTNSKWAIKSIRLLSHLPEPLAPLLTCLSCYQGSLSNHLQEVSFSDDRERGQPPIKGKLLCSDIGHINYGYPELEIFNGNIDHN